MNGHLGLQLSAYVDRRLDPAALHAFDQHLVACQVCRHAADQERRILASLRTGYTPGVSSGLQAALLEMAHSAPTLAPTATHPSSLSPSGAGRSSTAPVWSQPTRPITVPVPTVAPASPALHRSPRRAAALAGLAATASAAAAIGFATAGPVQLASVTSTRPVTRVSGSTSTSGSGGSTGTSSGTAGSVAETGLAADDTTAMLKARVVSLMSRGVAADGTGR